MFLRFRFVRAIYVFCIVVLAVALVQPASAGSAPEPSGEDAPNVSAKASQCANFAGLCAESVSPHNLESSYLRTWQLVKDNTMYPERLQSWNSWRHKYDGKLLLERDLERAVVQMLCQLGDQYTYFRGVSETQTRSVGDEEHDVVSWRMLDQSYGYISIRTFSSRHVALELQNALQQLHEARSYIIDLRDNKGGYVDQALQCFSTLVESGKFVSLRGRQDGLAYDEDIVVESSNIVRVVNGVATREPRAMNMTAAKPLVVLVNDGTRSASEMLAGALRDVRRARLIGSKTFGKGVVQGTWSLDSGCSIKIAMAHFILPGGARINGRGIQPDILAEFATDGLSGSYADNFLTDLTFGKPQVLP